MARAGLGWVVLCDFDGTIAERDVCLDLLERYTDGDWQSLEIAYDEGRISLEECLVGQVGMLSAPLATLTAHAREHVALRPGFTAFVAWCRERGVPVAVISAGLDFYIDAILAREGLSDLPTTCIRTVVAGEARLTVQLPLAGYATPAGARDFKQVVVREWQAKGWRVAFVGDGSTDIGAARSADHVFARDKLLAYCRQEGIAHSEFADFADVRRGMARLTGG